MSDSRSNESVEDEPSFEPALTLLLHSSLVEEPFRQTVASPNVGTCMNREDGECNEDVAKRVDLRQGLESALKNFLFCKLLHSTAFPFEKA